MSAPQGWWIICAAYRVGPMGSRDSAERRLAAIERLGACQAPHSIEEGECD